MSLSSEGFLTSGVMIDLLKSGGKQPVDREILTILVITGARTGKHFFSRPVGSGSRSHCLSGNDEMTRHISSTDEGRKTLKSGGETGDSGRCGED
jgi:hypothetical protein